MPLIDDKHLDFLFTSSGLSPGERLSAAAKESAHRMLRLAKFLEPRDRTILEMACRNQLSGRQIAKVLGVPPGTICRRVQRLCARIGDPLVAWLVDETCSLPPEHRQLAIEHFVQGDSMRDLADRHRMTVLQVRRMLHQVSGWFKGRMQVPA